ncbi:hypothetical protein AAFC00_005357 [Neodothiora populina]|uniref:Lipocalin-like domain-containing protein n=1 Tax=Neodothiora populina TaxID=2781224 RepID=A0ABR3PKN2_9PEZI
MADVHERRLSYSSQTKSTYAPATPRTTPEVDCIRRHDSLFVNDDLSITITEPKVDLNGDLYTLSTRSSPSPRPTLRERLIGTWLLESYVAYPTPSCKILRPTYPMTKAVTGIIMYTPDGYMSAHMMIPGQAPFKRGEGEEAQWAEAGKRSFCYAGPYYISDEGPGREEVLRHTFQVCNLPGWLKDVQIRTWKFEEDDDLLVLGSEAPTEIKGDQRVPVLKWRRARQNANGSPPAPTPQIKVSGPGEP